MNVVTRFAPSPTGKGLHIGGLRTALYNYLWAMKNKGQFLIRVDDTDEKRSNEESLADIIDSLSWCGIKPSKKINYFQSKKKESYRFYANALVNMNKAYVENGCVKLSVKKLIENEIYDSCFDIIDGVLGPVRFNKNQIEDFVILKQDGNATYNFATVLDDKFMNVNYVMRGQEHLINTVKQKILHVCLKMEPPNYIHMPVILNQDGSKMSKRQESDMINVSDFRKAGYLPEAIVHFVSLLGWTPKNNKPLLKLSDMVEQFDFRKIRKTNPRFDIKQLGKINKRWMSNETVISIKYKIKKTLGEINHDKIDIIYPHVINKCKTINDFIENYKSVNINQKPVIKDESSRKELSNLGQLLATIDMWDRENIIEVIKSYSELSNRSMFDIANNIRKNLTHTKYIPPIDVFLCALGRQQSLNLLKV
ncbi:MAG: putative Glutamate--tRNA ligase 2 [Promethearchaeota archaeon]|nr:MAG: putative Glutamate--tRNA ligase 2 [Candidatus Lokiarchaeota archaeon]